MTATLTAILPTIVLLILGNLLRRSLFLDENFWNASDKLTYFILFPALLITKVSQVNLGEINFTHLLIFITAYFLGNSFIVWLIHRKTSTQKNQLSSIYQGVLRFNSYIYFSLIASVWGNSHLILAALVAGIIIPIVNIFCIAVFSLGSNKFSAYEILKSIIKNPLIIASAMGFVVNFFPEVFPVVLWNSLDILSKAALPLALLSVGAAVRIKALFKKNTQFPRSTLWITTAVRLFFTPLLSFTIAKLTGINHQLTTVLVILAAVPTATSSYILSKQLGGDADLMVTIISLQTIISIISLVFWINLLL